MTVHRIEGLIVTNADHTHAASSATCACGQRIRWEHSTLSDGIREFADAWNTHLQDEARTAATA